ncbi:MAG: hypothetical protein HOQ27_14230, partial [Dermatophilaceae bacterium]|nr:hypothetical protein [Dermatophilaceae bacterium]
MPASDKTVKVTLIAVAQPYAKGMAEASTATKRLGQDIDNAGKKTSGFATSAGKATSALKGMAVGAAAVAGTALVAFLGDAVKAAGDLEQSVGGVDAVFKDSAGVIHDFGKTSAESVGLSTNAFNELITVTGAMLKNKGLDDFANKSLDLIKIGADLSATYGGSAKEAVEALNAAMRGESDPIERYGISINETAVNAELAAKGLSKLTGQALEQAKAQARIDIITRQSADALGKFAGEADTLQGQQQRLSAEWENAKASLGQALLPALTSVTSALRGGVDLVVAAVKAWGDIPGPIKAAAGALVAFKLAQGPLGKASGFVIDTVKSLREALDYAGQAASRAGGGFKGAAAGFKTFTGGSVGAKSALSGLSGAIGGLPGVATVAATAIGVMLLQSITEASDRADKMRGSLTELYKSGADAPGRLKAFQSTFSPKQLEDYRDALQGVGINWSDYLDAIAQGGPALDAMNNRVSTAYDNQGLFHGVMGEVVDVTQQWTDSNRNAAVTGQQLADAEDRAAAATKGAGDAAADAMPSFDSVAAQQKAIAEYAKIAADANKELATALLDARAAAGDADAAAINYQASLDAATKSVKENGRTLDINTEKGRANKSALLDLKDAALRSAEANLKTGQSADTVKGQMDSARESFIKVATQMNGGNRKAAEALATKYGLTRGAVDNLKNSMDNIPSKVASKVQVETAAAKGALAVVNSALGALDGQVVTVTVRAAVASAVSAIQGVGRLAASQFKASGGPIYGPGTETSDSVPAMLSNGEYVIRAAAVKKYGLGFFDRANSMRLASGGPVQKFASGGSVRAPLDQFYGDYVSSLGDKVTPADITANRKAIADATNKLRIAEMKLAEDRRKKKSARQIAQDEAAVAKARDAVTAATDKATAAQKRYNSQQGSALSKFGKGLSAGVKNTGAFIANIEKLASRGYVTLAQQLAEMNNEDAEKIAAQAASASTATLNTLSANVNAATAQQNELDHIGTITAILGQVRTKNIGARAMAAATGIDVMEILDAAEIIKGKLSGNRNATKLLADLAKRSKG